MAITASVPIVEAPQRDGRRWVRETHSDATGVVQVISYLGPSNISDTAQSIATARAAVLNTVLADQELEEKVLVQQNPLPLRWQTASEFLGRLRALYLRGRASDLVHLAIWVTRRIDDGTVTALQLRTAFGLSAGAWSTLETKMRNWRAQQEAIDLAAGE